MEIRKRVQGRVYSSGKVWTKDLFEYRNLVEHEFMNIGLKWTICMWGLRNNEQIVRGKSQVGFRRAIYKSWKAENSRIRLPRARNSVTTRSGGGSGGRIPGARANVKTHLVHPHTRASGSRRVPTPTAKIPTEQPMTGMTCTRCRTEHLLSSSPRPLRLSLPSLPNPQDSLWSPLDRLSSSREVQA